MKRHLLFLFFCVILPLGAAQKEYGELVIDEVVSVIDGDTFKVNIEDIHPLVGDQISIRIKGIDTPERRSSDVHVRELAAKAKQFLESILQNAEHIELHHVKRGKYFRIVADVYADGRNVGEMLIDAGLAKPYDGKGSKPLWSGSECYEVVFK